MQASQVRVQVEELSEHVGLCLLSIEHLSDLVGNIFRDDKPS